MSDKPYENNKGVNIRVHSDKNGKDHVDFYDRDPRGDHSSIHINYDSSTGYGTITEKDEDGSKEKTDIKCFLTTACMRKYKNNFDDNCHELTTLRWLRDNIVDQPDIDHYYEVAPLIVNLIDKTNNPNYIYKYIYDNIIVPSIYNVDMGNYELAYKKYKNGVISLEDSFAKPELRKKLIKTLKSI